MMQSKGIDFALNIIVKLFEDDLLENFEKVFEEENFLRFFSTFLNSIFFCNISSMEKSMNVHGSFLI